MFEKKSDEINIYDGNGDYWRGFFDTRRNSEPLYLSIVTSTRKSMKNTCRLTFKLFF